MYGRMIYRKKEIKFDFNVFLIWVYRRNLGVFYLLKWDYFWVGVILCRRLEI